MRKWVFLNGGYYDGIMYGVVPEEALPNEILMHHYENPQMANTGITILGITQKGPDDITIVEAYARDIEYSGKVIYKFVERIDPAQVVKMPDGDDYTLQRLPQFQEASDD